jgi:hypothetical protein
MRASNMRLSAFEGMLSRFEVRDSYVQWFPVSPARTQTASCAYTVTTYRRVIKTIVTLLFPAASAYICNTPPRAGPSHHFRGLSLAKSPVNDSLPLRDHGRSDPDDRTKPGLCDLIGIFSQQSSYSAIFSVRAALVNFRCDTVAFEYGTVKLRKGLLASAASTHRSNGGIQFLHPEGLNLRHQKVVRIRHSEDLFLSAEGPVVARLYRVSLPRRVIEHGHLQ